MKRFLEMTLKALGNYAYLSTENHKLVPNESIAFLIWNLPYKLTCPFATAMCKLMCYAKKAEDEYPDCNPCRQRNWAFSKTAEFAWWMIAFISKKMVNVSRKGKQLIVRIHESGDFYNAEYFNKWMEVCTYFLGVQNIRFMCYTKSLPYVVAYIKNHGALPANLSLRFSVWEDTNPVYIALAEKYNIPIYTADTKEAIESGKYDGYDVCRCSDCATCGHCWSTDEQYKKIVCEIH